MFPKYDLNCQKFVAVFMAGLIGTISSLATIYGYIEVCRKVFPENGLHQIMPENNNTLSSPVNVTFDGDWYAGPGLTLLISATLLKAVNMICHLLVPTPKFCRSIEGENDLEVIVFKKEPVKDTQAETLSLNNKEASNDELNKKDDERLSLKDVAVLGCNKRINNKNQIDVA